MAQLKRGYPHLKFSLGTLKEVIAKLDELYTAALPYGMAQDTQPAPLKVTVVLANGDEWEVDDRSEFYRLYNSGDLVSTRISNNPPDLSLSYSKYGGTDVVFSHPDKSVVFEVFEILEAAKESAVFTPYPVVTADPAAPKKTIFIGHGNSSTWRELKEFFELQRFQVLTYETEKRLGSSVKETLERMLYRCNFAILVHTAEDEQRDGAIRARQNVVHETGLFQGRLGFARAIILREEGCEGFSNVAGINEIRFRSVREAYGEALLAINRELEEVAEP